MATRDITPVTVTLDRARPYRVNDTDRNAVWVGPGEVEVPRWVADEWAKPRSTAAPASPYDGKQVPNLREAFKTASDEEIIAVPGLGEKSVETVRAWASGEDTAQPTEAEQPPATVETVVEKPLETVETVEVVDADDPAVTEMPTGDIGTGVPKSKRR